MLHVLKRFLTYCNVDDGIENVNDIRALLLFRLMALYCADVTDVSSRN